MKIDGISIRGITCDSRKVQQGYIFVAIEGDHHDGNDFIEQAIKNGAVLIVTEKTYQNKSVAIKQVQNARATLAELLNEFYDYPSEKLTLIGVTGTNGKTTTTHIVEQIFRYGGYKTGLIGTLGIKLGEKYVQSTLTTPDAEVLFKTLSEFVEKGVQVVIMEVSSHGLKFFRTHGLSYDVAIHTNIERDHMNLHKTFEDYLGTKKKLFDELGRNKLAIINMDDRNGIKLLENNPRVLAMTYGLNGKATLTASSLIIDRSVQFTVCLQRALATVDGHEIEPTEFNVNFNIMGRHNVYNGLAAIAVALYFGIPVDRIQKSLKAFSGLHRRMEKIYDEAFTVIDDFSHNPSSYEAIFQTLQTLDYRRLIIVNAIRGHRGVEINTNNVEMIASWLPMLGDASLYITLSEDVVEAKDGVQKEEVEVYRRVLDAKEIPYKLYDTLTSSIDEALSTVRPGDVIALLGAQGMDAGRDILFRYLQDEAAITR